MNIEPITLKLDSPADLIAYLPYRFGYVPTESLAILTLLEPAPGEVALGMAARVDLADLMTPGVLPSAAAGIRAQMSRDPTIAALTVMYTDAEFEDVRSGRGAAGAVLTQWLDLMGTGPTEAFLVSPTAFACVECVDLPCCPPSGQPLDRLSETAIAARMVLAGESLAPSREALGCPRDVDPDRLAAATRAADRERRGMRKRTQDQQPRWRRRMLDLYGTALAEAGVVRGTWQSDPAVLGRLGAAMADADLRDALVAWTVSGERAQPGSEDVFDGFGGMVTGSLGLPDRSHLQSARLLLTEIARHAAPHRAGFALAMLGWLAWWSGEGARAEVLMRECLEDDPGCSLGILLRDILAGGVRPGWAYPHRCVSPGVP